MVAHHFCLLFASALLQVSSPRSADTLILCIPVPWKSTIGSRAVNPHSFFAVPVTVLWSRSVFEIQIYRLKDRKLCIRIPSDFYRHRYLSFCADPARYRTPQFFKLIKISLQKNLFKPITLFSCIPERVGTGTNLPSYPF